MRNPIMRDKLLALRGEYAFKPSTPRVHIVHTRIAPKPTIKKEYGSMDRYSPSRPPSDQVVNCHTTWASIAAHEARDTYKPVSFQQPKRK